MCSEMVQVSKNESTCLDISSGVWVLGAGNDLGFLLLVQVSRCPDIFSDVLILDVWTLVRC